MERRRIAVLVNGLPGAGKSTLARALGAELGLPVLGKDAVKETLADRLAGLRPPGPDGDRAWSRALGAAAGETLWTLLADAGPGAVLETWLPSTLRETAAAGLRRSGVPAAAFHEVWCDVPERIARERYAARAAAGRHPVHGPPPPGDGGVPPEWDAWVAAAGPLALGPVHRVDTTRPVDAGSLAAAIRAEVLPSVGADTVPPDAGARAVALLRSLGADGLEHPGGTLLAHLERVGDRLASWGARPALRLAGLCHAFYGTDGFATALLPLERRADLREAIGDEAEATVYFYASCDRRASYATLAADDAAFRDRFTGRVATPPVAARRDFAELTAVNELDLARHDPALAARWGPALRRLFDGWDPLLSAAARADRDTVLGPAAPGPAAPQA